VPRLAYLLSVWTHVVAMAAWLGGMLFLSLVIVPALRRLKDPALAVELVGATGRRFRTLGWICLATLVVTGVGNLHGRGIPMKALAGAEFWGSDFGHILSVKLALFGGVVALSLLHDAWIGRQATRTMREQPGSGEAETLRLMASWIGRINIALSLAITLLGVMLVRGTP
jgi:copper resistance protein D